MHISTHHNIRAAKDDINTGLSLQTVTIIAVCVSVAGLLGAFFLYRIIRSYRRSSNATPFPPIQPLSHHREQQLARFEGDPQAWSNTTYPAITPHHGGYYSTSDVSLLKGKETLATSRRTSFSLSADNVAHLKSLLPMDPNPSLAVPTPPFHLLSLSASSTSLPSADIEINGASHTSISRPSSATHSKNDLHRSTISPGILPLNNLRHGRPISMSSSQSTLRSKRSIIRGAPHGPHSSMQIILPAPLAPNLLSRSSSSYVPGHDNFDRRSIVDRWVSAGRDSAFEHMTPSPEVPKSSYRNSLPLGDARPARRPHSRPKSLVVSSAEPKIAPPVPRIPSGMQYKLSKVVEANYRHTDSASQ